MMGIKVNYPNKELENIHKARILVKIDWIKRNEENKDKRIIQNKEKRLSQLHNALLFQFFRF